MINNLYGSFLEATRNVFQLMLDLTDISDRPGEAVISSNQLSISIGVSGDLAGEVIYRFPYQTSLDMVNIMSGMEVTAVDDFVISAVSEIANIISGNVLTALSGNDLQCDLLPPVPQQAGDDRKYSLRTTSRIETTIGDIYLDIKLNPTS